MKWLTCLPKVRCSQGQIPTLLLDKFVRLRDESGGASSLQNIKIVMFVNNQLVKIVPSTLSPYCRNQQGIFSLLSESRCTATGNMQIGDVKHIKGETGIK